MPADLVKRIDLDLLYPPFVERLLELKANCRILGCDYHSTEGHRTYGRSARLHDAFVGGAGPRAARAGHSQHNFGLATDECLDADLLTAGLQPDWRDEAYEVLGQEAKRLGLHWGGGYSDRPHIGWPGFVSAHELAPLRKIWSEAVRDSAADDLPTMLRKCWAYIDSL